MMQMAGGLTFNLHGLSGLLAIALMFVHALWASIVLWRHDERMIRSFHKFSVTVWLIWLIPYFSPLLFVMRRG